MTSRNGIERLVAVKEGYAIRTMQKFLGQPLSERLRGKDPLTVLDFGSGDGVFTVGIAKALAGHFRPALIDVAAVNADEDCKGNGILELDNGITRVNIMVLESLLVSNRMEANHLKSLLDIHGFDLITLFNPSPPDELFDMTRELRRIRVMGFFRCGELDPMLKGMSPELSEYIVTKLHMSENERNDMERLEQLKADISLILMRRYSVDHQDIGHLNPDALANFSNRICLERVIADVLPHLLAPDGILFMAFDDLVPLRHIRKMLTDNRYAIEFDSPNDPDNVFAPSSMTGYNKHLIAAILS
jgi:hypothetical protein